MNKSKTSIPLRERKKMDKEIHKAQMAPPTVETPILSDTLTPEKMLKGYPKKIAAKNENLLKAAEKEIQIKKKRHAKVSKRTTPGTVPADSTPKLAQMEGLRWIKTLIRQNITENKIFRRKSAKNSSKNKLLNFLKGR